LHHFLKNAALYFKEPEIMAEKMTVNVTREGPIAVLEIDNVSQRNALTMAVKSVLVPALKEAEEDTGVRCIVITGAGNTFSAGGDASLFGDMTPAKGRQIVFDQRNFLHLMLRGDTPIVAAVEGFAYGAGFGLAMAADYIVAAEDAKFCAAFNKIGLMPDGGLLWTLPQRVGMGRAKDMLMCATVVDGVEAKRLGIADQLAKPNQALNAAMDRAAAFASAAPLAVATIKSAFARYPLDLEQAFAIESDAQPALMQSEDAKEARRAFFAKEKPNFRGA
jgi:enoyl-CoA hydratase/carnithine racemase